MFMAAFSLRRGRHASAQSGMSTENCHPWACAALVPAQMQGPGGGVPGAVFEHRLRAGALPPLHTRHSRMSSHVLIILFREEPHEFYAALLHSERLQL